MNPWSVRTQIRRRIKDEEGVLYKQASGRIALCHPSPYSVAMSSLGYQTIYREINLRPDTGAERAFLPDKPEEVLLGLPAEPSTDSRTRSLSRSWTTSSVPHSRTHTESVNHCGATYSVFTRCGSGPTASSTRSMKAAAQFESSISTTGQTSTDPADQPHADVPISDAFRNAR